MKLFSKRQKITRILVRDHGFKEDELEVHFKKDEDLFAFYEKLISKESDTKLNTEAVDKALGWDSGLTLEDDEAADFVANAGIDSKVAAQAAAAAKLGLTEADEQSTKAAQSLLEELANEDLSDILGDSDDGTSRSK